MNLSTSSSDGADWARFLRDFFGIAVLVGVFIIACLVVLDPYDTGRFALFSTVGVPKTGQRTGEASRGRDPRFDWAIIGNSRIQLLDPERLGLLVGGHMVSLAIPGTGPLEQLTVENWFADHHGVGTRGLIMGLDETWCTPQRQTRPINPFPFWLYAARDDEYVAGLVRWQSLEMAAKKIKLMMGKDQPARADGYDNYEIGRVWHYWLSADAQRPADMQKEGGLPGIAGPVSHVPAASDLAAALARLPPAVIVVLIFTPAHISYLPQQGPSAQSCERIYAELAHARQNTVLLDFLADNDIARSVENFWDPIHYRSPVARKMEDSIATAIKSAELSNGIQDGPREP